MNDVYLPRPRRHPGASAPTVRLANFRGRAGPFPRDATPETSGPRWFLWALFLGLVCVPCVANPTYAPTYGARYGDDGGLLRDILGELKAIRAEVTALRRLGSNARPAGNLADFVKARCAACHEEAVAQKKGAEFVLLGKDGKVPPLSLSEKKRIMRMVGNGTMPPGAPLTDDEKDLLNGFLFKEQP